MAVVVFLLLLLQAAVKLGDAAVDIQTAFFRRTFCILLSPQPLNWEMPPYCILS
jgi:hypothetical protein